MSVYGNGLSIAGKASSGKSIACFPDVCFSPPSPSAGWIPIPFANTVKASDTANGSKTVFIKGKPVMLKDKSYFSTSSGNEAAAGPKGISTGVKKGKAYFTSWSMDVKVEGLNVCRHSDLTTHNHGSTGNTAPWQFTDTSFFSWDDCKDMKKKMNRACAPKRANVCRTCNPRYNHDWKEDHCDFLTFKPRGLKDIENPEQLLQDLKDDIAQTNVMEAAINEATEQALSWALNKLILLGAKAVGTKFVPVVGWIYSGATLASDIADVRYYQAMYDGAVKEMERITSSIQNVRQDIQSAISSIQAGDLTTAASTIADWQRNAATINPCVRARKCMLVPMRDTSARPSNASGARNSGGMNTSHGCCPGQTGHHLIPDSFVKNAGCQNYNYNNAPVVCVEGTTQSEGGSHEAIHTATNEEVVPRRLWGTQGADTASYSDVRDAVIRAHAKTFPFSTCPRKCLKEQLDNAYQNCNALTVKQIGRVPASTGQSGGID
ncbi:hypothetical protein TDB9533_00852 [Thalassocella blandensis]|nr:hypothetical protein TDB9533_00852 [Thalassocella blandensis]